MKNKTNEVRILVIGEAQAGKTQLVYDLFSSTASTSGKVESLAYFDALQKAQESSENFDGVLRQDGCITIPRSYFEESCVDIEQKIRWQFVERSNSNMLSDPQIQSKDSFWEKVRNCDGVLYCIDPYTNLDNIPGTMQTRAVNIQTFFSRMIEIRSGNYLPVMFVFTHATKVAELSAEQKEQIEKGKKLLAETVQEVYRKKLQSTNPPILANPVKIFSQVSLGHLNNDALNLLQKFWELHITTQVFIERKKQRLTWFALITVLILLFIPMMAWFFVYNMNPASSNPGLEALARRVDELEKKYQELENEFASKLEKKYQELEKEIVPPPTNGGNEVEPREETTKEVYIVPEEKIHFRLESYSSNNQEEDIIRKSFFIVERNGKEILETDYPSSVKAPIVPKGNRVFSLTNDKYTNYVFRVRTKKGLNHDVLTINMSSQELFRELEKEIRKAPQAKSWKIVLQSSEGSVVLAFSKSSFE